MKGFRVKKQLFTLVWLMTAASLLSAGTVPPDSTIFPGLKGKQLIDSLRLKYRNYSTLSYNSARDMMYGEIDITADSLTCVYSGWTIHGGPTAAPRTWTNNNDINCEHTWPQSLLDSTRFETDMHHLYATEMLVNADRGNFPFGEITPAQADNWYRSNVILTTIPTSNIDEYARLITNTKFQPRAIQKGNTARSMYYVLTMYQLHDTTTAWWTGQKNDLYDWHVADPADAREIIRTRAIAAYQQNKVNPFVLDSTLIRRAYFPALGVEGGSDNGELIKDVRVYSNQPNPFSVSTSIRFTLPSGAAAEFSVYDVSGRKVYSWTKNIGAGNHIVTWNGQNDRGQALSNGVYMFRLQANGKPFATGRMVLVK
jgi:endonuclease I